MLELAELKAEVFFLLWHRTCSVWTLRGSNIRGETALLPPSNAVTVVSFLSDPGHLQ